MVGATLVVTMSLCRFIRVILSVCVMTLLPAGLGACDGGEDCGSVAILAFKLTVIDSEKGTPICDADVTSVDDSGTVVTWGPLSLMYETECRYGSFYRTAGQHTFHVEAEGYEPFDTQKVDLVWTDGCSSTVEPMELEIALTPKL